METTMSSPVVEGQEATSASPQVTETPAQSGSQPQETTVTQVENNGQNSSEGETRKASDFEAARQIKKLTKIVQSLQQSIEGRSQSAPQSQAAPAPTRSPVTKEELLANPLAAIERMLDEREQKLMGEIPKTLFERDRTARHERGVQEGWKQIKSSETYKRDPQGEDRINDILMEENADGHTLQEYSQLNPKHAAELALATYEQRYGSKAKSPTAPTKGQMTTTATSVNVGGGKSTLQDEAARLQKELMADGSLMNDPAFRARMDAVVKKSKQETLQAL